MKGPWKTKWAVVGTALSVAVFVSCGGGGDPDSERLAELREEAEFSFSEQEVEQLVSEALAIAERHDGEPLGAEAATFATATFLDKYLAADDGLFADRAPAPDSDVDDEYLAPFQSLVGYLDLLPAGADTTEVTAELRRRLDERVEHYLFRLDEAVANRQQWVDELRQDGATSLSFTGTDGERGFAEYEASLRYLQGLAEIAGLPEGYLADLGLVIDALVVAQYVPDSIGVSVDDDTITTTYSEQAVADGAAHVAELTEAVEAARTAFPET